MPLAQETNGLSGAITLVPVARIGVPLLLKTILPHPAAATGAPTGRIFFSIAALRASRNERTSGLLTLVIGQVLPHGVAPRQVVWIVQEEENSHGGSRCATMRAPIAALTRLVAGTAGQGWNRCPFRT